MNIWWSYR